MWGSWHYPSAGRIVVRSIIAGGSAGKNTCGQGPRVPWRYADFPTSGQAAGECAKAPAEKRRSLRKRWLRLD